MGATDYVIDATPTTRVVGVRWALFIRWLQDSWEPGQHMALIGPTGEGKTSFAVSVLKTRKYVLALDPKGEDDTLSASGFQRVTTLPLPRSIKRQIAEEKPTRLIVGGPADSDEDEARLRHTMAQAIRDVRHQGGWTLYADEFQILADLRMFGLGKPIEQALISARRKRTSVVTAYQAPAWVPRAATRQASIVVMWPTRDVNMIKAVAEGMGRDWRDLQQIVHMLPPFHIAVMTKRIHAPILITLPPKVD